MKAWILGIGDGTGAAVDESGTAVPGALDSTQAQSGFPYGAVSSAMEEHSAAEDASAVAITERAGRVPPCGTVGTGRREQAQSLEPAALRNLWSRAAVRYEGISDAPPADPQGTSEACPSPSWIITTATPGAQPLGAMTPLSSRWTPSRRHLRRPAEGQGPHPPSALPTSRPPMDGHRLLLGDPRESSGAAHRRVRGHPGQGSSPLAPTP